MWVGHSRHQAVPTVEGTAACLCQLLGPWSVLVCDPFPVPQDLSVLGKG